MEATQSPFDSLPEEIVEMILEECAANGALAETATRGAAIHLVNKRFYRIVKGLMPNLDHPTFTAIERIVIRADTTYHKGVWLKITFFWRPRSDSAKILCLTITAQDLSDKDLVFWAKNMRQPVKRVDICLEAPPSSPDNWGAFLMLYAKARDAFYWAFEAYYSRAMFNSPYGIYAFHIHFEEPPSAGRGFWGSHYVMPRGEAFFRDVPFPYLYEYILCAAVEIIRPAVEVYAIAGVTFSRPFPRCWTSFCAPCYGKIIDKIPLPTTSASMNSIRHIFRLYCWVQSWSSSIPTMAEPGVINEFDDLALPEAGQPVYNEDTDNWEEVANHNLLCLIFSEHSNFKTNFRIYLDNYDGPCGGPAAFTRLHRFKTLRKPKSDNNLFSLADYTDDDEDPQSFPRRRFQLIDVVDEVAVGMSELWHPAAHESTLVCRSSCPTLAAMSWPTSQSANSARSDDSNDRLWVDAYP